MRFLSFSMIAANYSSKWGITGKAHTSKLSMRDSFGRGKEIFAITKIRGGGKKSGLEVSGGEVDVGGIWFCIKVQSRK